MTYQDVQKHIFKWLLYSGIHLSRQVKFFLDIVAYLIILFIYTPPEYYDYLSSIYSEASFLGSWLVYVMSKAMFQDFSLLSCPLSPVGSPLVQIIASG